ncbi:hypothetical protein FB99_43620 (plasmid) [Pantoea agglomerans]|nr:hypothetical protein FB99_43620 [Pantoea agglomerans]
MSRLIQRDHFSHPLIRFPHPEEAEGNDDKIFHPYPWLKRVWCS